jgi:hypothetical protein
VIDTQLIAALFAIHTAMAMPAQNIGLLPDFNSLAMQYFTIHAHFVEILDTCQTDSANPCQINCSLSLHWSDNPQAKIKLWFFVAIFPLPQRKKSAK